MRLANRLEAIGQTKYAGTTRRSGAKAKWTGRINLDYRSLQVPKQWKQPKIIFVNSMSDLFHENVPEHYIKEVFSVMEDTPRHTYQILTKRAERLEELSPNLPWSANIWMGVSVEDQKFRARIDHLKRARAAIKFLSLEPLLGPLELLDLEGIDWVIAGGESGPGARPVQLEWVRSIRDQCQRSGVAFHFKQWGGVVKKRAGRVLDGRTWDEYPVSKLAVN
jgi:protein gp37